MSIVEELSQSFVRGVGKTCGAIVVCGIATGLFYTIYSSECGKAKVEKRSKKRADKESNTEVEVDLQVMEATQESLNFKKMFDNL